MNGMASMQVAGEIRGSFFNLLDSLSALRSLIQIDLRRVSSQALASEALACLVQHQDLENCSVFLRQGNQLKCMAGTGFDEEVARIAGEGSPPVEGVEANIFSAGEGLMGLACQTGQLQYCRDCESDERFKALTDDKGVYSPGSLLCIPIQFDSTILGVLNVSHALPEFFEPWHQYMLSLFAGVLGQMLYNQHLLFDLDLAVQQRTLELQEALEEAENLKRRYQQLSTLDELTGLHNRRYFFAEGESVLARALRYQLPFSLLLLDADHFKRVNDTWGHTVGDHVLCRIAKILREEVRSGDIVARLGGEEFVVALPNTGPSGMDLMARRIQQKISEIDMGGEVGKLGITVSIGMTFLESATAEDPRALLDLLYAQADKAMYECKKQGRNRRLTYRSGMGG